MKKFLNKLPLFIISLLAIMFLCYPKVSANEELYVRGDIMLNINRFEDEISDPLGKETFLYDDSLPDKEGQISFGKKGYSKEKYNIVLAEVKAIREYIEKPENVRYFMDYSEFTKIDDAKHHLLFPLVKEFKKHLDELNSSSVTGTRLDVRYYKQEIKKYGFLFQTDTGNPDNNFYDDPITLVQMPGTGEQVIKYYVKKADANLYGEKHSQITSLISNYDDLDFESTELTNSFNSFVSFYNDFINSKRYTGNLVKFKIKKEDTTTELNLHGHVSFGTSYYYPPFYYYFKSGEHILRTHFATEEEINNGKIIKVNGVDRKFIPKVFYYALIKEDYDTFTVKKQYIDLKTTGNITRVGLPIIDNTFYVEWVPEIPVVTFKIRPLAENFKNHEILYSTKIVNFSSWEGNIPKIPDYQEFAKYFTDADEAYFLNSGYHHDKKYIIKSIGWRNKYNGELYNFNEVPREDLTLYATYEIYEMDAAYFYRFYDTNCYYDNKLIGKKYVSFEIDKDTKIAKFKQDDNLHNDIHIFDEYLYDHNRRYHLEKFVDDEGNEIDLNGFDFDRYENLLKEGKCRLIYSHYEKFYQVEFHCKEIQVYGNALNGIFKTNLKKYFFKGDIIGEDITREFDKYCQDPQGKVVQKLSYWREKETKERVDLTKPLEERNYVLEPVIEDTEVPFIPIERVILETNYLSIDPFDTDTYEVKIPYKVYPENATEKFSLASCINYGADTWNWDKDDGLKEIFESKKIQHRLEDKSIVLTVSKEIYEYYTRRFKFHVTFRDINFSVKFMIIPNSIFFPTNLSSFGYLESWHKTSEQNYIYNKGINSLCLNFELHSEKLRKELKEAKELFESTYFVPNAYQENNLPKETKIITDELIYNRLFYLIEESDLYLNNIRSTLINPKIRYNPGCFKVDLGYSHNVILYHLLINLQKTKSEFESSLKTIDTYGTTNNGFEVVYHNHLGKPFRKFKYIYDINLRLPLVNPELGYHVHKDGDNYVARKFMYWALTQQTIGEGSYPGDIFDGRDLFYHYSKSKVIHLYPVYKEVFDGFIKINVYDADKNKVFETKIYKEFVKEHHYKYSDNLIWQDIISYDEVKEAIRGIYCNYRYDNISCPKFCSLKYLFDVHYLRIKLIYLRSSISELDFMLVKYDDKYDEAKIKERLEPYRDSKVMFYNYESKLSNLIADFQFEIRFSQKTHDSSDYNYVFKEYIETWLLQSPYRHMIRELEFIETSSSFGMKYFHLYINFKRDNLLKNYPDYIDFTLSDIFGKDITSGRPLRIIANHNGNIPENPVVYKERLVFLRDNFQNILDTVIFVNYLSLNAGYPKQKFLEIKYKKEVVNSITELSSLIDDSGLDQKTVDRNAFMYEAIYRRILSNILDGIFNNHGGEVEDIDQSLLGKMRDLLEKVQDFKKNISTVPFEESTEIEFCLHRDNLTELQDLEGAIIKSIDYFPFVTNNYPFKLINQKFYDEAKTKLEELQKNVRVNDLKIKALLEEMKHFNDSCTFTNTLDKPYLLKRGIKYLLVEDYGRFTKAYSKVVALSETADEINKGMYDFIHFPGLKRIYETNYSIFQTTKEKAVLGTWFHPDVTEIFKVKKQLEEIRDKVFIASKGDHYELKYPNYYLEYAVHHELIKDISEIESCLTNVQTLFQEDVDKIKNEKASKISTYDESMFMGGDKLKLIFESLESFKKEVQITLKTDPELLQKDQKYLVANSYRLLEEAVLNLKAKIETRKVDKKTIEADINKYQENLTALQKQVIIGRRLIGIVRLQDLLKRAQSLHTKVKIQGDSGLNSGDKYLPKAKYHNLENLIVDLQKQTDSDFPTNDSFEKYYGSKEEELTNLEKSVLTFKKTNSVALMASLFTFLGIILIGLIVFPIVIKLKKDKKEKK